MCLWIGTWISPVFGVAKAAKGERGFAKRFCRRLNPAFVCERVSCLLMFDKLAAKWGKTGELHIYIYIYAGQMF